MIADDIGIPEKRVISWWQRHTYKNGYYGFQSGQSNKLWFTKEEKDVLKSYFDENSDLGDRRYSIAKELGVDVKRVITWWANRKTFLKLKGIDIPRGTPTRPEPKQSPISRRSLTLYTRGASTKISEEHKVLLSEYFSQEPNPSLEQRGEISEKTGLSSAQVYMWFYLERKRKGIETVTPRKTVKKSPEKRLVSKFIPQVTFNECTLQKF